MSTHRTNFELRDINGDIRLIDPDGDQIGVVPVQRGLDEADDRDLDLVEVAPNASPPVCRILDYGKFKYEQSKRSGGGSSVEQKTLQLSPQIADHDLDTKLRKAADFLADGNHVRFRLQMKGRERKYAQKWVEKLEGVIDDLDEHVRRPLSISDPPSQENWDVTATVEPG